MTRYPEIAEKIMRQKAFGVDRTVSERQIPGVYDVAMLGYNYRMNEIQAAIGIEQIKRLDSFLERREKNYYHLEGQLKQIDEISLFESTHGDFQSSYYCLSVILKDDLADKRFEIVNHLKNGGIGTSVYYPKAIPEFRYYQDKYGYSLNSFPNASKISNQSIALPVGPHLGLVDMETIASCLKEAIAQTK